jgi:hypothetical protein
MQWLLPGMLAVALALLAGCDATSSASGRPPLAPWPAYNNQSGGWWGPPTPALGGVRRPPIVRLPRHDFAAGRSGGGGVGQHRHWSRLASTPMGRSRDAWSAGRATRRRA